MKRTRYEYDDEYEEDYYPIQPQYRRQRQPQYHEHREKRKPEKGGITVTECAAYCFFTALITLMVMAQFVKL